MWRGGCGVLRRGAVRSDIHGGDALVEDGGQTGWFRIKWRACGTRSSNRGAPRRNYRASQGGTESSSHSAWGLVAIRKLRGICGETLVGQA